MLSNSKRKQVLSELIDDTRQFRFCSPSDDPDEQTQVTAGYRYLITQFQRLASPVLSRSSASRLNAIEVGINDLYSAYDAKSELDALLPEIEGALESLDDDAVLPPVGSSVIIAESRLVELRSLVSDKFDFRKLVQLCEEINSAFGMQSYLATAMLIRGLLDHIPPVLGYRTFAEVANNYVGAGRSFRGAMQHLENASRRVGDMHLHMPIRKNENLPTAQQVNCSQQLDLLLSEIVRVSV